MPIYEFICYDHGRFERIFPISEYENIKYGTLCGLVLIDDGESFGQCTGFSERVSSIPANINIGKPTIIFRDPKTGRTELAASDYDTPPQGYIKELLSNPIERSKYEREEQKRVDLANEIVSEKMKQDHAETRKNRHADIESRMNDFPNDGTREFLRKAMARKSKRKFPEKKSQVKLTVNHTDSSNLIK